MQVYKSTVKHNSANELALHLVTTWSQQRSIQIRTALLVAAVNVFQIIVVAVTGRT